MGSRDAKSSSKKKGKSANPSPAQAVASSPTSVTANQKKRKLKEVEEPAGQPSELAEADNEEEDEVKDAAVELELEEPAAFEPTKADKGKAKKRRKEEQRALENPPSFSFDTRGFKGGRMIQVKDVRDFVLHLLSDEKAQQWLFVNNKRHLRRVVVAMIPGITPPTLGVPSPALSANLPFSLSATTSKLPVFQSLFSHACPTKAPGEKNKMHSCYQAFTTCPLTGGEKDRREKARKEKGQTEKTLDPTAYLMSQELMIEHAYPIPTRLPYPTEASTSSTFDDWKVADGWIEAPWAKTGYGTRKVLGIDCEMCLTEDGSELTRVSVVDGKGRIIYNSLVKPDKPILDYLTRYSGLTAEKLEGVTTKLVDIQRELSELIDYNTILLGHSLECDLRVLKLIHPWVIDTSVIYQHPRGPPFKASLKWLAQKWLKKDIQNAVAGESAIGGHDSEEDARTCVDLLNLKMQKGPGFGEFVNDQETIFERIARGPEPKTSAVVDHGTPGQWHGAKAKTAIACSTDDEILKGMMSSIPEHDFTIGRFMELSHSLGWSQPTNAALGKSSTNLPGIVPSETVVDPLSTASLPSPAEVDLGPVYATLNSQLAALHASLPPLTALIIFTGHSDPQEMARLSAKKAHFDKLWKTIKQSDISVEERWMEEDDRNLLDQVERCRSGLSFFCIK